MSHAIYQTPALILKTKNMRESNKLLTLYTERFGIVYASTQSIRALKSKMRFHTNALSLVNVDLVRGRDIWKLTGIHENMSSFNFVGTDAYLLLHKISALIRRLCNGEEAHDEIWTDIGNLYRYLDEGTSSEINFELIEIIFVVRLLYQLGYWEGEETFLSITNPFINEIIETLEVNKPYLIQRINEGIGSSQL
ncbi:MAG: DNA repair protein RecO [Candidatus Paceibacteria bacterium]|jgi:DNA repair protein RecO